MSYQNQAFCTPCKLHYMESNHQYKTKNPAMPLKGETNVREGGGTDHRGTLGCHINTCGMDPESMTVLLAHLYTSLRFKQRNSDVNALPSITKVSSCIKLCRGLGLCFL